MRVTPDIPIHCCRTICSSDIVHTTSGRAYLLYFLYFAIFLHSCCSFTIRFPCRRCDFDMRLAHLHILRAHPHTLFPRVALCVCVVRVVRLHSLHELCYELFYPMSDCDKSRPTTLNVIYLFRWTLSEWVWRLLPLSVTISPQFNHAFLRAYCAQSHKMQCVCVACVQWTLWRTGTRTHPCPTLHVPHSILKIATSS